MNNRIIFMGTPEYSAGYLSALTRTGFKPSAVITQPDRPVGRDKHIEPTPVKRIALENDIPVYQPKDIRDSQWTDIIRQIVPDIIIVVAFGQIIPKSILDIPLKGCINVHPSLLPKYRGAAPLQATILNGDSETGVTIMQMDEKMDHGPILAQETMSLDIHETLYSLRKKTTEVGVRLLLQTLSGIEKNAMKPEEQDHSKATYTKLLAFGDGKINFTEESAETIYRKVRALNPEPGTWTLINDKRLKILEAHPIANNTASSYEMNAGLFIRSAEGEKILCAQCASGILQLDKVQLEGKKPMSGIEFIRGNAKLLECPKKIKIPDYTT